MKIIFLITFYTGFPIFGWAQLTSITGSVKDEETAQPISFCTIRIANSNAGTTADAQGHFKLDLPDNIPGAVMIISSLGYQNDSIMLLSDTHNYFSYLKASQKTLDEIVITGISPTTFKENPVSISTVSSLKIERTVENNIIDVLVKNVPGLNAVKTGPNISKPFIRGLGYNRVLTLYDGIRQEGQQWGDEHGIEVDSYSIERAEVIKGPASLMYGSDAVAGVVSLFPYLPRKNTHAITGRLVSEYQSNNGLIGNGLRLGYTRGHWIWSCNGAYRLARNYKNAVDGRIYNTGFSEKNFATSLRYKNEKQNLNLNFTVYDNLQGIPDGSRDSVTRKFTKQVSEGAFDNIKRRPIVSANDLESYTLSPLHQHIQHYRVYSNNQFQLGKGDVNLLLALQQSIRREYNHPTMPQQAGLFVRLNTLNYGLGYNAPEFSNLSIAMGVNGMYQDNKNKAGTDFPIPDFNLFDIGGYGFVKWKHNEWTMSGGVRYDTRSLTSDNFYVQRNPANGFNEQGHVPDTTQAVLQFPALHQTFRGISLSVGATYAINEALTVKANVARGYRAPNIAEIASNGLDPGAHIVYIGNRNFVPEFSFQQDVGLFGEYDEVSLSMSVFNNMLQHYIYLSQLTDANGKPIELVQGNKTFQYQQASARLYGMEATLDIHPKSIKGFNVNTNMAVVYGKNTSPQYDGKGTEGEHLPFIPPFKILSSIRQDVNLRSDFLPLVTVKVEIDFNAAQNRYLALYNTETRTKGYSLFNVACHADIKYAKKATLQLQLQVNNVFDAVYQSNLSRLKYFEYYTQSPKGMLGMYGMGRNICIRAAFPF